MATTTHHEQMRQVIDLALAEEVLREMLICFYDSDNDAAKNGFIELRAFPEGAQKKDKSKKVRQYWLPVRGSEETLQGALSWAQQASLDGYGVFVAWNPRAKEGDGSAKNVAALHALYADLDYYKLGKSEQDVREALMTLPQRALPTFAVASGGGAQLIWLTYEDTSADTWKQTQELLRSRFADLNADQAVVTDTARVLRLPGLPNLKQETPRATGVLHSSGTYIDPLVLQQALKPLTLPKQASSDDVRPGIVGEKKAPLQLADCIEEGGGYTTFAGRNDMLFRSGCKLRDQGFAEAEITSLLESMNHLRCVPPMSDEELHSVIRNVMKYVPTHQVEMPARIGTGEDGAEQHLFEPLGVFRHKEFEPLKKVIEGLHRGEVGMLQARPNIGKTTLALNLAMSIACGRPFEPLYEGGDPMRVMYLDKENVKAFAQMDLRAMQQRNFDEQERRLIDRNLCVSIDPTIGIDELNLSNPIHFKLVAEEVALFAPHLLIFDTLAASFQLVNENDNSEMERAVNKPVKDLARKTGAAVLMIHHIGKMTEGSGDGSKLYRGRGASSLAAMVRAVYDLDSLKDSGKMIVDGHVVLHCAKIKGRRFEDVTYKLDFDKRWFDITQVDVAQVDDTLAKLLELLQQASEPLKREEIVERMQALGVSPRSTDRALKTAAGSGYLVKTGRGLYELRDRALVVSQSEEEEEAEEV